MTIHVKRRVWRTDSGALVPDGHPDASFLAYTPGMMVPDLVAARVGLTADLAADPARTVEVIPTAVIPSPAANLSGVTIVPDPVVSDTSVSTVAVVAPDAVPERIVKRNTTRVRES